MSNVLAFGSGPRSVRKGLAQRVGTDYIVDTISLSAGKHKIEFKNDVPCAPIYDYFYISFVGSSSGYIVNGSDLYGTPSEDSQNSQRVDGFYFYMNYPSNYINAGMTTKMHIGYYANGVVDASTDYYIYTNSNNDVLRIINEGWSDQYGQGLSVTALKEGQSVISVTHPVTGESASLDIYVSPSGSGWNFYNIPQVSIEPGRTTNFYNYSGMVIDDFDFQEHRNGKGLVDHYIVTMKVWNSLNLYGVVTSHNPDGSVHAYQMIDKKDTLDTSFVSSLQSLYYSVNDLYCLIQNPRYYSGQGTTTENKIEIEVPAGGHLEITNNVAVSDAALFINYIHFALDVYGTVKRATGVHGDKKYEINDVKDTVANKLIIGLLANKEITSEIKSSLKSVIEESFKKFDFQHDSVQAGLCYVDEKSKEFGYNLLEEIEKEICSAKGVASMGESIATTILPTGYIIDGLYTINEALNLAEFEAMLLKESKKLPVGIFIYAPIDSSKFVSNGISVDTCEDTGDTVVHAYRVTDISAVNINENTFGDSSIYYAEQFRTYDITLYKNGAVTQPQSAVTVRIPIPEGFNTVNTVSLKVYRNNEDGTLTDMNAWVEGDYMVFETDHFSYYSIVDETVRHKWDSGEITTQPTCTKSGSTLFTCTTCGATAVKDIPAAGHQFLGGVCQVCGQKDGLKAKHTVSGTLTSGKDTGEITIELYGQGAVSPSCSVALPGNATEYHLNDVPEGTYIMRVSQKDHVMREYHVTVDGEAVSRDVKICLIGDVNGDGKINVGDVAKVYSHIRKTALLTDEYALKCADVAANGKINVGDASKIYSHVKGTGLLW